jgi:ribonuclease P/MRP protein subunit RPP1
MKFYDIGIQTDISGGESSLGHIIHFAEKFGFNGIVICGKPEFLNQIKEAIKVAEPDIEVYAGVKIEAKDPQEMRNLVNKYREEAAIVVVAGGDYDINRAACENPKVDILAHPEKGRMDGGLDEASVKFAANNNVAIGIDFAEILHSFRRGRSYNLSHISKNVMLCKEFGAHIILSSGARSKWDMRNPRELIAVGTVLGMELNKAFDSMSTIPEKMVEKNKARLEGKIISEGVEVVE